MYGQSDCFVLFRCTVWPRKHRLGTIRHEGTCEASVISLARPDIDLSAIRLWSLLPTLIGHTERWFQSFCDGGLVRHVIVCVEYEFLPSRNRNQMHMLVVDGLPSVFVFGAYPELAARLDRTISAASSDYDGSRDWRQPDTHQAK